MTKSPELRCAGLCSMNYSHHSDHIACMGAVMEMPVLFTDHHTAEFCSRWYPGVEIVNVPWDDYSNEYLAMNYDVMFRSDLYPKTKFLKDFLPYEKKRKRPMRSVHCPHGFSDKGFWLSKVVDEDITLIYGQNMLDLLREFNVLEQLGAHIISGNYRYSYYKQHREYLDELLKKEILQKFQKRKARRTLLYAPTWMDAEKSCSFFDITATLIEKLDPQDDLIIKIHPLIEEESPAELYFLLGKYENRSNVVFLTNFSPVYPVLAYCDVYIGDMSSVGYDFLSFNRPMFFLNQLNRDSKTDRGLFLFQCGKEIRPKDYPTIYEIIEKSLQEDEEKFSKIRQNLYAYTFGEEKAFKELKKEILDICEN